MADLTLQSTILRLLAAPGTDRRIGKGRHYFPEAVKAAFGASGQAAPPPHQIQEALWGLVGRGLVFPDMFQSAPENWEWRLTEAGNRSAADERFNPDDPERFIERFRQTAPGLPAIVDMYLREALTCYVCEAYLASAVMVGVASEAAIVALASDAVGWLGTYGAKLEAALKDPRTPFAKKFEIFRNALASHHALLPDELREGIVLTFDALLDAFRVTRNDSGHPSGKVLTREDQYIAIQMAGRYLNKVSALKRFFSDPGSDRPI